MSAAEDRIKQIEEEIKNTQKNKATSHHIGKLKAQIAQLKEKIENVIVLVLRVKVFL